MRWLNKFMGTSAAQLLHTSPIAHAIEVHYNDRCLLFITTTLNNQKSRCNFFEVDPETVKKSTMPSCLHYNDF